MEGRAEGRKDTRKGGRKEKGRAKRQKYQLCIKISPICKRKKIHIKVEEDHQVHEVDHIFNTEGGSGEEEKIR